MEKYGFQTHREMTLESGYGVYIRLTEKHMHQFIQKKNNIGSYIQKVELFIVHRDGIILGLLPETEVSLDGETLHIAGSPTVIDALLFQLFEDGAAHT